MRLGAGLIFALALAGSVSAEPAPRRVVSLNPCLDSILLEVADPSQIAALSHYSRDPRQSAIVAEASRFPVTGGSAEEIVALKPDLVITSGMGAMALVKVLPRLHVRSAVFTVPESVAENLAQVDRVAALVGHPDRGENLKRRMLGALAAAAPKPGEPRLGALIYEYHGIASGPGTMMSEVMGRAGFENLAPRYGLDHTGLVPLESLLANPPQVLLAGKMAPNEPGWADRVLSHPALRTLATRVRVESFPEQLMFCGGPIMIRSAAALAQARENALAGVSR